MKKDYYTSWTHGEKKAKLARALLMIQDSPIADVATFTGVPKSIISKAVQEMGMAGIVSGDEKVPLLSSEFYDSSTPVIPSESKEERVARVQKTVDRMAESCGHGKHFTRCSHCMKVLGSELHYVRIEDVISIIRETELGLSDFDPTCDAERAEMAMLISDRVYKTIAYVEEI